MSARPVLYYSPGACSIAPHIALRETGADFDLAKFSSRDGSTRSPEYLAVNPRGLVPAFAWRDTIVTECSAILITIGDEHPESGLLPADPVLRAKAIEWTCWCSGALHMAFRQIFRAYHTAGEDASEAVTKAVEAQGRRLVAKHLTDADGRLGAHDFALGPAPTIADCHLFVYTVWAQRIDYPLAEKHPNYGAWNTRMRERLSVQETLRVEGLA